MLRKRFANINLTSVQRERYLFLMENGVPSWRALQLCQREDTISRPDSWLRRLWLNLLAALPLFPKLGRRD